MKYGIAIQKLKYRLPNNTKSLYLAVLYLALCWQNPTIANEEEQNQAPIPKILTLTDALEMLDENHPSLLTTKADIAASNAKQISTKELKALDANLSLELRQSDRIGVPGHDFINDSRAVLTLDKPLTNFGRDKALINAIETEQTARADILSSDKANLRVAIISAFFDVLIADYNYAIYDEEMTITFLPFNDAREKLARYGEASELEVQRLESIYFSALHQREIASNARRTARLQLALALNRPNEYPDQLVEPDLSSYQRALPDYDDVFLKALKINPTIRAADLHLEAAKQELSYIMGSNKPTLGARLQAYEYNDKSSTSRDQFRASIYLDIPLSGKRKNESQIAKQQAKILRLEASKAELIQRYRLQILVLVQKLQQLELEITAAASYLLYTELNLDKSRQEYEMELRTRLGRANADLAHALHREAKAKYQRALIWEKIDALVGNQLATFN